MQNLLLGQEPFAYSTGAYGWSCDYYNINGIIVSTGYSPIGSSIDYDILREYEEKAEKINGEFWNFQERKEKINNLLLEFIEKIK